MKDLQALTEVITARVLEQLREQEQPVALCLYGSSEGLSLPGHRLLPFAPERPFDALILAGLPVTSLGALALGCPRTAEDEAVLTARLTGKPVWLAPNVPDLTPFRATADRILFARLLRQEKALLEMGIRPLEQARQQKLAPARTAGRRALITQRELEDRLDPGGQSVAIPRGAIVTPLARDLIRARNLSIREE